MQKLNLDLVQLKITKPIGEDIYSYTVNDIDNLKYRVIRAAHSVRDFKCKFQTYHWSDLKTPITVQLIDFNPRELTMVTPDFPPCTRQAMIESTQAVKDPRDFTIDGGCYLNSILAAERKIKQNNPDVIAAHDYLDDAKLYLDDVQNDDIAYGLFVVTNTTNRVDYTTAALCIKLFSPFLSKGAKAQVNGLKFEAEQKFQAYVDRDYVRNLPRILKRVLNAISSDLKEEHIEALKQKYEGHPVLLKAEKQATLFDKMFDVLLQIELESKDPKKKIKPRVKKTAVTFDAQLLREKFARVKAIVAEVSDDFNSPLLKGGYEIKAEDEGELDLLVTKIESDERVSIVFSRMLKSLEAKCSNIRLHHLKICHIKEAQGKGLIFRSYYLILEFREILKKWNETNASPSRMPALQV